MHSIYSAIIAVCLISAFGMIFHIQSTNLSERAKHAFSAAFGSLAIAAGAEWLGVWMDINPGMSPYLRMFAKLVELSFIPLIPSLLAFGCNLHKEAKPMWHIALSHIGLEVILAPFQLIIDVDKDGVFHQGMLYPIYIVVFTIMLVYMIWIFGALSKHYEKRDLKTVFAVFVLTLCGMIPSLSRSDIRTSVLSVTMASILMYLYYGGLDLQHKLSLLKSSNERIREIQHRIIVGVADLIEFRDLSTGTHVKDTSSYVEIIVNEALKQGVYPETITKEYGMKVIGAASLHDVGKITISDVILQKPGKLTDEEFVIMKTHSAEGGKIVHQLLDGIVEEGDINLVADIARHHHEKWNGTGYPDGLAGEEIPVCARIAAIADVYDALTAERVYKKPFPAEKALAIILEDSGKHFDPILGPMFVKRMKEILAEEAAASASASETDAGSGVSEASEKKAGQEG